MAGKLEVIDMIKNARGFVEIDLEAIYQNIFKMKETLKRGTTVSYTHLIGF